MIRISETFINQTKGYRFGDSGVYETFTDNRRELFTHLQREYGRCTSRVYVDPPAGGPPKTVGWVFEKTLPYEDARDPKRDVYVREVWVTVHD